jgi:hypothetical protein
VLSTWMRFSPKNGAAPWETRLSHRQYFPREMAALLHYNGFSEQVFRADFGLEALRSTSDTAVVECSPCRTTKRSHRP